MASVLWKTTSLVGFTGVLLLLACTSEANKTTSAANSTASQNPDQISDVKVAAQEIFAILRVKRSADGAGLHPGESQVSTEEARRRTIAAHQTNGSQAFVGAHAQQHDASSPIRKTRSSNDTEDDTSFAAGISAKTHKIRVTLSRLVGDKTKELTLKASSVIQVTADTAKLTVCYSTPEPLEKSSVKWRSMHDITCAEMLPMEESAENTTAGLRAPFKLSKEELENLVIPVGTALAQVMVEKKSKEDAAEMHRELERGIHAMIDLGETHNESAQAACWLAHQIHLQELAVCGHLILNHTLHPSDYLSAVGAGVGTAIQIVGESDSPLSTNEILGLLKKWVSAHIKIGLIIAENYHHQLDESIAFLANEIAGFNVDGVAAMGNATSFPPSAKKQLQLASAHYAKSLWNIRVLNIASLAVVKLPPQLVQFAFEDEIAVNLPASWLRFSDEDINRSLEIYERAHSLPEGVLAGKNGTTAACVLCNGTAV